MFDKLLLMADGYIVFYGEASEAAPYFASQGYKCPPNYNPADFLRKFPLKDHHLARSS